MQRRDVLLAFCVGLPILALALYLIISTLPYMSIIGKAVTGFLIVVLGCLSLLALASTWHLIGILRAHKRRKVLNSRVIVSGDVVVLARTDGTYSHLSAEHEAAKLLPAPRLELTESDQNSYSPNDLEILALVSQGKSQADVAKACNSNQTYVSRLVRRYKAQHNMVD